MEGKEEEMTAEEALETKVIICDICRKEGKPTEAACNNCSDKVAIEALEKQIPKKPINGCCPDCGILLKKFSPYTYCAKCGRKLDAPWCEVEK